MANLLYRLVLHSPLEVSQHYHHSYDLFPDSGRVLPFGSGATVVYNYVDLEFYNLTPYTFQFEIWQDDTFLYGNLRCSQEIDLAYHVVEEDHTFVSTPKGFFRYNKLYQHYIDKKTGNFINKKLIRTNFAPLMYQPSEQQIKDAFVIG